ncbi:MAG: hypothetical protein KKH75_07635 [Actinobacteria bacterium]|nr:hypothetical protein [Actinomycetota bacterium]
MDPLWVMLAEVWWVAPAAAGAGTVGWLGLRGQRTASARRLEIDATRYEVRSARHEVTRTRAEIAVAQAEVVRVRADRSAFRATDGEVAAARRALQQARSDARAAATTVRAHRARLRAARATKPRIGSSAAEFPLAKLVASHNAVLVRWMDYETDPAKAIAYPQMSDGKSPVMAAFLRDQQHAQWLRPASLDVRMSAAEFAAYRDAVRRVQRSFDAAEHALVHRGGSRQAPVDSGTWADAAQDLLANAQRAVAWSTEAMARMTDRRRPPKPPTD